nr:alanine--tRNA ligase [Ipomoea batatas]GMD72214.1 alanine--tRNA ligase [Ipomoea batatas]
MSLHRLHSAGHLLDVCIANIGWGHLKPGKAYHFPDGPFVEYQGTVPQNELQIKQKELEAEANNLISKGEKVSVSTFPYEEARLLCGGSIPDYIPKGSTPRIVKFGENPGCPCGGTHVSDVSEIKSLKVLYPLPRVLRGPPDKNITSFALTIFLYNLRF